MDFSHIGIEIDDKVRFPVRLQLNKANGGFTDLGFVLHAHRLDSEEFAQTLREHENKFSPFLQQVVFGWEKLPNGKWTPPEFSTEAFADLCKVPGMAAAIFRIYSVETAVKEKN